jgi:hypothetical protein
MKFEGRNPQADDRSGVVNDTITNCRQWREAIRVRVCGALAREEETQLAAHLATCGECRRYAGELQTAAAGLQWLGSQEVNPSAGFRARWTAAVEDAAQPATLAGVLEALGEWCCDWLSRNRRPASAVAALWLLTLLLRLSTPEAAPRSRTVLASSPIQIVRLLNADGQLLAWHFWWPSPTPPTEPRQQPVQPRSDLPPARPAARSGQELEFV